MKKKQQSFSQQEVTFKGIGLFPEGLEKIFLAIYIVLLPYITGVIFLFFYVGSGDTETFMSLNQDASFMLTWIIGYEILAVLIILYIIKSAIKFSLNQKSSTKVRGADENFRRP